MKKILCLGEALVDISPLEAGGSILATGRMQMAAGGAPANVAVGLARLGASVGFVGKVGDDFFGRYLRDVLVENGVDTTALRLDLTARTGLAFVTWDERGDADYLFYRNPSADTLLHPDDLDGNVIASARLLQFGSLLLATEPSASATMTALEMARNAGVLTSYDVNLRPSFWKDEATARAGVLRPLEGVNLLKINRAELKFLSGEDDPATGVRKLWRDPMRLVIVTLDKAGCYFSNGTQDGFVPAFTVESVDTVGAGDSFLAGLLEGLSRADFDFKNVAAVRDACRQAAATGALAVTRPGAIPSLPTRQETDAFLRARSA